LSGLAGGVVTIPSDGLNGPLHPDWSGSPLTVIDLTIRATTTSDPLSLAEELLLITLDGDTGQLIGTVAVASALDRALATALLMELTLLQRLDSDTERLFVVSSEPVGSSLLDDVVAQIAAAPDTQSSSAWVQKLSARGAETRGRLIAQLVERGILKQGEQRVLGVLRQPTYRPTSGREEQAVRARILAVLHDQDIPEPRDALLIGLLEAASVLHVLLDAQALQDLRPRILEVARLEELSRSVRHTISGLKRGITALEPFESRSFRFQWPADLCTAWALEMEAIILGWYVLVETGSVVMLSVYGALQFMGTLLSPTLGMLGDRLGLRNVLAGMRFCYALLAGVILLLALGGHLNPTVVLVIATLAGLLRPTDSGLRSALVSATVPPARLTSAIAISRMTLDSAKVGGALVGTSFIALFGMAPAYMVITVMYLCGALLTVLTDNTARSKGIATTADATGKPASAWSELKVGMTYVWRTPRLLAAMSLATVVNLTAFPFIAGLMPYIARDVFHLDQRGLGMMVASFACGSAIGSVAVSILGKRLRPARTMIGMMIVWFAFLLGFAFSSDAWVAMGLLVCAGVAQSLSMLPLSILLLRTSEARFRGRIMGVSMMTLYALPIGLLIVGNLIPSVGYQVTAVSFILTGLALTLISATYWRRHLVPLDTPGNAL
jgi:Na+/melibiose symporter-like transporter